MSISFQPSQGRSPVQPGESYVLHSFTSRQPIHLGTKAVLPEVQYAVFGDLHDKSKPVILLIPALTGSALAATASGSIGGQGQNWFRHQIKENSGLLPTSKYTTVCIGHVGGVEGLGAQHSQEKWQLCAEDLQYLLPEHQGHLNVQLLQSLGIEKLHAVVGCSVGARLAAEMLFQSTIPIKTILDISGPAAGSKNSQEFFVLQRDVLLKKLRPHEAIPILWKNLEDANLLGHLCTPGFRVACEYIKQQTKQMEVWGYNDKDILAWVRQVGFLRFVGPRKFDEIIEEGKRHMEKPFTEQPSYVCTWKKPEDAVRSWLHHQGQEFCNRCNVPAFASVMNLLCSPFPDVTTFADALCRTGTALRNTRVREDTLFPDFRYFDRVASECRRQGKPSPIGFEMSNRVCCHDAFFGDGFPGALLEEMYLRPC